MLSILRRNAGSWAIKIILSFIALTFIWWGVGTYSEQGRNVAATVGGEAITTNELAEAVAGLEKSYREVYGPAFTPEMAKALDLKKQAMDSLVQRKIVLAEAGKMGLSATDEEVQREIAAVPAFQQDGQFREERYRSVLAYNRVGIAEFEASKRVEITLKKIEGSSPPGRSFRKRKRRNCSGSRRGRSAPGGHGGPRKNEGRRAVRGEVLAKYEQAKERFRTPARVKLAVAATLPIASAGRSSRRRPRSRRSTRRTPTGSSPRSSGSYRASSCPSGRRTGTRCEEGGGGPRQGVEGKADFDAQAKAHSRGKAGRRGFPQGCRRAALGASVPGLRGLGGRAGRASGGLRPRPREPDPVPGSASPLPGPRRVVEQIRREKGKDLAVVKRTKRSRRRPPRRGEGDRGGVRRAGRGDRLGGGGRGARRPAALVQDALLLPSGEVAPVKTVGMPTTSSR